MKDPAKNKKDGSLGGMTLRTVIVCQNWVFDFFDTHGHLSKLGIYFCENHDYQP
jgi:hypothetical protein